LPRRASLACCALRAPDGLLPCGGSVSRERLRAADRLLACALRLPRKALRPRDVSVRLRASVVREIREGVL